MNNFRILRIVIDVNKAEDSQKSKTNTDKHVYCCMQYQMTSFIL